MSSSPGIDRWDWYYPEKRQFFLALVYLLWEPLRKVQRTTRAKVSQDEILFAYVRNIVPSVLEHFDTSGLPMDEIMNRFKQRADKTHRYASENPYNRPWDSGRFLNAAKKAIIDNKPLSSDDLTRIVGELQEPLLL